MVKTIGFAIGVIGLAGLFMGSTLVMSAGVVGVWAMAGAVAMEYKRDENAPSTVWTFKEVITVIGLLSYLLMMIVGLAGLLFQSKGMLQAFWTYHLLWKMGTLLHNIMQLTKKD